MIATGSMVNSCDPGLRRLSPGVPGAQPRRPRTYTVLMSPARVAIFVCLALILGIPFALKPRTQVRGEGAAQTLVVITPHVPQIRSEFAPAFSDWHRRHYG